MITAEHQGGDVIISADLAPGESAFFDTDWLPAKGTAEIPAMIARDGRLASADGRSVAIPDGLGADEAAARALLSVAYAAAAALEGADGAVEVAGRGAVAHLVRELVASRAGASLAAVVDVTGEPAAVRDALDKLPPLGTLVLAGEALGRELTLDLYQTVHVKGLRVVGLERPPSGEAFETGGGRAASRLVPPANVVPGTNLAADVLWFRVG